MKKILIVLLLSLSGSLFGMEGQEGRRMTGAEKDRMVNNYIRAFIVRHAVLAAVVGTAVAGYGLSGYGLWSVPTFSACLKPILNGALSGTASFFITAVAEIWIGSFRGWLENQRMIRRIGS